MDTVLTQLVTSTLASRIWRRDPEAFVGDRAAPAVYAAIGNRSGWLDFDVLAAVDRRLIHYHFAPPHADFAAELEKVVLGLNPHG